MSIRLFAVLVCAIFVSSPPSTEIDNLPFGVRHLFRRNGRGTSSPLQFGQIPFKASSPQRVQNVHSKEQIMASMESVGRLTWQRSQLLLISNIAAPPKGLYLGEN
jgi:hypothetical protein